MYVYVEAFLKQIQTNKDRLVRKCLEIPQDLIRITDWTRH